MNLIEYAVPIFLTFIIGEWFISWLTKKPCYRFDDFINNISMGIFEQLFDGAGKILLIVCYVYLTRHFSLFSIQSNSILSWILLWLLVDCAYYWLHRATHRINFLWIGHSVHHQSEQYNFSVALRQGILQGPCTWFFYLPIALLGFPIWMFLIVWQLNTLYQFFIHTTQIESLGPLEFFLNTPSHHRVHHGQNPQYINKNYAGSLIIWDKIFGTFEPEDETVRYGVTEPLTRFNPFYANIKVALDTWYYTQGHPILSRLKAFIMPPEWTLQLIGNETYQQLKQPVHLKHNNPITIYQIINTLILLLLSLMESQTHHTPLLHLALIITIILTAVSLGSYLDKNSYYLFYDGLRFLLFIILFKLSAQSIYAVFFLLLLVSISHLSFLKTHFLTKVKRLP
jgi:sterol desaturase/sphingolipid hydroxylase (fatty acid hydroxylase superfamily)